MKAFLRYWLPVLFWLGFIFVGSTDLMSAEQTSRMIGPLMRWLKPDVSAEAIAEVQFVIRKLGHLAEYAILAMLLWRAVYCRVNMKTKMSILFIAVWLACGMFAASDEFHQSFVASRTATSKDVLIDICGALVGLLACLILARRKSAQTFASFGK
jgi:VanZ family protein